MSGMKLLRTITDQEILGRPGLAEAKSVIKARAVVRNSDGLYAVICAGTYRQYTLPGGGVEDGENPQETIRREIREETGCECLSLEPLGIVEENRAHCGNARTTFYYAATVSSNGAAPCFTQAELDENTVLEWVSLEEMIRLIADVSYQTPHCRFMQARDMAALEAYLQALR